jgi:hypothetical protein
MPPFEVRFTAVRAARSESPHVVTVTGRDFSTILPEGEYRVSISGLPQGYTVKSVFAWPLDLTYPFLITYQGIADKFSGAPVPSPGQIAIRLNTPSSGK